MLKALMLRSKIDKKNKEKNALLAKKEELEKREAELAQAIEEAAEATEEEQKVVEEAVEQFEAEKKENEEATAKLDGEIADLENELKETEAEQEREAEPEPAPEEKQPEEKREEIKVMNKRFFKMNTQERDAMFAREDVKTFLAQVRQGIKEKRALTNVGLLVPEVFLGLIRENIEDYSKLYKHVFVRQIAGEGRNGNNPGGSVDRLLRKPQRTQPRIL